MKKLALFFFAGLVLLSCVNEEYDFSKIDGTAVIGRNLALPIGSLEKIKVGDLITIDESDPMIIKETDGDYAFYFADNDPIEAELSVPSFSVPFEDRSKGTDYSISMSTGHLAGKPTPSPSVKIEFPNQRIEKVINVTESHLLPHEIQDVDKLTMEMLVKYNFSLESGACHVEEGFMMDFPDWMTIALVGESNDYMIESQGSNKNIIRFKKDVKISAGAPYEVNLMLTEIDVPDGCVKDGGNDAQGRPCKTISLEEGSPLTKIIVSGGLYVDTKDFPVIPDKVGLNMNLEFSNFEIKSANVVLDMAVSVPEMKVKITEYPDFFANDDVVIDIYDPQLKFNIRNDFPLTLVMTADITGYKNGTEMVKMHFGEDGDPESVAPMIIRGLWEGTLIFSRLGKDGAVGLPKVGDLLIAKPDEIKISNIEIKSSDDFVLVETGKKLKASAAYELYAPLAFGNEFRFRYDVAIQDLGLDLTESGIKSASLILNAENSLPLDFSIAAKALDKEGNPAEKLNLEVIGDVMSGTQHSPSTSPIEIRLNSLDNGIELNSLKLTLTATCPSEAHLGIPLNEAQGLKISDVALRLPDGVTVDVTNIFKADPGQDEKNI